MKPLGEASLFRLSPAPATLLLLNLKLNLNLFRCTFINPYISKSTLTHYFLKKGKLLSIGMKKLKNDDILKNERISV
jgi:hypothetical protein